MLIEPDGLLAKPGTPPAPPGPALVTTNLLADWDVDALALADHATIVSLLDQSGHGHHAPSHVGHEPTSELTTGPNGRRYALFSGHQICATTDVDVLPSGTAERVVFLVFRCHDRTPIAMNLVTYGPFGSQGQYFSMQTAGGNDNVLGSFWSSNTSGINLGDISVWHAVALQIDALGNPVWWVDGARVNDDTGVHPNTGAGTQVAIGGSVNVGFGNDGNGDLTGDIARVLAHGAMTDPDIVAQFDYLAAHYSTP